MAIDVEAPLDPPTPKYTNTLDFERKPIREDYIVVEYGEYLVPDHKVEKFLDFFMKEHPDIVRDILWEDFASSSQSVDIKE